MLEVSMMSGEDTTVKVYSDGLLYLGSDDDDSWSVPRYRQPRSIYAMSLLGPEQALRAIAAGSSSNHVYQRSGLHFKGEKTKIEGRWHGKWNCKAIRLQHGIMHMIAMPQVSQNEHDNCQVIITGADDDLNAVIYERLILTRTTPLLPAGLPGQPLWEKPHGLVWRDRIVKRLRNSGHWELLSQHPECVQEKWHTAGVLTLNDPQLDKIVSQMILDKTITIPEPSLHKGDTDG